ncbi:LacI family DNA-binding transcriptional regulator [Enterococcus faecalis]
MTTIREIAKLSGYSVTTVSRVLNNHPYVAAEKRKKIQRIIDELNYKPNALARHLSLGKTNTIGVLIPYNDQPYFDKVLSGIIQQAFQQKLQVLLLPTNYDQRIECAYLEELATGAFDGMIVLSKANELAVFAPYKQQLVFCENIEDPSFFSIFIDRKAIYLDVFQKLQQAGITEVALTVNRDQTASANTRKMLEVYTQVFGSIAPNRFFKGCRTLADGQKVGQQLIKDHKLQAVLANSDEIAAGIQQITDDRFILIGQENTFLSEVLHFSTIHHPLRQLGQGAVSLFKEKQPQNIRLVSSFIQRASHC